MPYVAKERAIIGRDQTLARQAEEPRPGTRWVYINKATTHDPANEQAMRVTLPAFPWEDA